MVTTDAVRHPSVLFRDPPRLLCEAVVLVTFAGLVTLRGFASPGTMGMLLAAIGIVCLARERRLTQEDLRVCAAFLVIPSYYVINMAMTGWDANQLDKPGRLVAGVFVYFAVSRIGIGVRALHWGAVGGSVAAAVLAAYQVNVLALERANGVMNAIPFGNYSLLLGAIAVAGWLAVPRTRREPRAAAATLLAVAAGLYASFASGTRGGWIMIPFLAWILYRGSGRRVDRVPAQLFAIAAALVVGAALVILLNARTADEFDAAARVLTASPEEAVAMPLTSIGARIHLYRVGIDAFLTSPLIGIGFANLPAWLAEGGATGAVNPAVVSYTHLHSSLIDTLARGGILGLLALCGFTLGLIRHFRRALASAANPELRFFALAGLVSVAGALLFSLTNVLFPAIVGTNILVMALAVPAGAVSYQLRREATGASMAKGESRHASA